MPKRMLTYRWFAKSYGWPPDVVDRLPLETLEWWPRIERAEARAAEISRPKG